MNRRSRVTVALLIMGCASVARAAGAADPATAPATTTATTTATAQVALPSFGLAVPLPAGYSRDVDTDKSAVMIVPADRVGQAQERVIMVNVMPARGQRFDRAVEEAVRTSGGMKVVRADAVWGGLKATELALPADAIQPDKPRTVRSLMLERNDYLYLLGLVGKGEEADRRAFDEVAAGTVWGELARATDGLATREPPLTLPAGGFRCVVPDPFRPEATKVKNAAVFVARDLSMRVVAARLTITVLPPPAGNAAARTLGDVKAEVERTYAPQWRLKDTLKWSDVLNHDQGRIQSTLTRPVDTPDGWAAAMIVASGDVRRVTLFAVQCRGPVEQSGRMDQLMRIIRASIEGVSK